MRVYWEAPINITTIKCYLPLAEKQTRISETDHSQHYQQGEPMSTTNYQNKNRNSHHKSFTSVL